MQGNSDRIKKLRHYLLLILSEVLRNKPSKIIRARRGVGFHWKEITKNVPEYVFHFRPMK